MKRESKDTDVEIRIDTKSGQEYFYKLSNGKTIVGHSVVIVGFIRDSKRKITFLKMRGSWTNCDCKNGYVLLAWEGVLNHLYNAIIVTRTPAGEGEGITKRKRKRMSLKNTKKKPNKSKNKTQNKRRIKTRHL